ncbi:MAG: winged helix-turn-helix transcriptional regulator [Helicobacteraceae bacterium]|nr:winged helix-turn-helix transcriptional regulator [Helicobacteraceae bacterium]
MGSYKPPYTITSKMLSLSTSIGEELTKLEFGADKIITPLLRKKNRIKTLAGTLEIEGNFMGEEKITAMLDGKRVLGTYQEVLEVEGVINAYKEFENYNYNSLDDLLKAHKLLMSDILTTAGSFRGVNVGVGSKDGVTHVAPPYGVVPDLMIDLFEWLKNSDEHILIKSCVFHYEFEFIHPFSDGNGRIGRLWQSIILYHWRKVFNAIPTESIIRDNQNRYYKALEDSCSLGECTPFIEFMLEVILVTIKSSVKSSVNTEDKVLEYIKKKPKITIRELSELLYLTTRAIEKQIANLKKENILRRVGSARKGYWEILDENR